MVVDLAIDCKGNVSIVSHEWLGPGVCNYELEYGGNGSMTGRVPRPTMLNRSWTRTGELLAGSQ